MSTLWSESLHRLQPYVPGEQPQDRSYVKLNTNENPYPPAPAVLAAARAAADDRLRLYPDPESS
ncbi:MAG TPA: histidinol-phosphate transaminase, partial [bacterium]|nr:histidinol-phosphate transaminase [bacterium]